MAPKFSLVVATVGRAEPLERLFESLLDQGSEFETIVVDQNEDDRVAKIVGRYVDRLDLRHLKSTPGLSRARNVGLAAATGEIVAFPDDDCWYRAGTLPAVWEAFEARPECDGLTGVARDEDGTPVGSAHWDAEPGWLSKANVWRRGCSITIFLRRSLLERIGGFDERLGAGAGTPYGACEETDLLLKALEAGSRIWFNPALVVHHEQSVSVFDRVAAARAYRYGMGIGFVLRRHGFPVRQSAWHVMRSFGGMAVSLLTGRWDKARFYRAAGAGKLRGWLAGGTS
jgi:glycosyltransferase involved in cell wall biosynthesis